MGLGSLTVGELRPLAVVTAGTGASAGDVDSVGDFDDPGGHQAAPTAASCGRSHEEVADVGSRWAVMNFSMSGSIVFVSAPGPARTGQVAQCASDSQPHPFGMEILNYPERVRLPPSPPMAPGAACWHHRQSCTWGAPRKGPGTVLNPEPAAKNSVSAPPNGRAGTGGLDQVGLGH